MAEQTTRYSYEELEEIVMRYKRGESKASEELIERMQPICKKYMGILKENRVNLMNRDTRNFIIKFISDPEIKKGLKAPYVRQRFLSGYEKAPTD